MPIYLQFANNNTYGLSIITKEQAQQKIKDAKALGGCLDKVQQCRALADQQDPQGVGNNAQVNTQCYAALDTCFGSVIGGLDFAGSKV